MKGVSSREPARLRILYYLAAVSSIVYGILLLAVLILPIYLVKGVLNGLVAFSYYRIVYYNATLSVYELERTRYLAIPMVFYAIFETVAGANLFVALREGEEYVLQLRVCFAGGLAGVVTSAIFLGVYNHLFATALKSLVVSLDYTSSAGLVILGSSDLVSLPYTSLLLNTFLHLLLSSTALLSSSIGLYAYYRRQAG
ncbi:hypothetical protein ACSU1N_00280 [Thermogladius sp. 4427co]|uniref:hypothetical protein n=1 Tax=Thermogladius sp. 4427co TaxID=3450718 RepID=UPI003F7A056D